TAPQEMMAAPVYQAAPPPTAAVNTPQSQPVPEVNANPDAAPVIAPGSIHQRWDAVRQAARQFDKSVPALIEHAQVRTVTGNVLVLSVPNDLFREKLNAEDKREALEKALFTVLQVPLRVQVVLADANASPINTEDPVIAKGLELGGEVSPYNKDERKW
ncbi:MAG: hypothetical protein K8J31_25355, partial [Anaerolineae bacterium]|nr:hypothetical protein [Anaerolineae bacterium]